MYESIQKRLEELFEKVMPFSQQFSKENYEEYFMNTFHEYKPLLDEIIQTCETSEDKDIFMTEVSAILPDKVHAILDQYTSKRKKESILLPYNMAMSLYIIPLFRYTKSDDMEEIVDRMVECWNDNGVSLDIQKSTYENIISGFKSRLCYITTAVCQSLGKGDDCYELNLLRTYRDEYLLPDAQRKLLVEQYYDIAPTIVKRIDKSSNPKEIYQSLWEKYIHPCIDLIEMQKPRECSEKYIEMVKTLQSKFLYT